MCKWYIRYTGGDGCPMFCTFRKAQSLEHLWAKLTEEGFEEEGWTILEMAKAIEGKPEHRLNWIKV